MHEIWKIMSFNLKPNGWKIFLSTLKSIFLGLLEMMMKNLFYSLLNYFHRESHTLESFFSFLIMITSTNVRTDNEWRQSTYYHKKKNYINNNSTKKNNHKDEEKEARMKSSFSFISFIFPSSCPSLYIYIFLV